MHHPSPPHPTDTTRPIPSPVAHAPPAFEPPSIGCVPTRAVTRPPGTPISVQGRGGYALDTFDNKASCWRQLLLLLEQFHQNSSAKRA